MAANEESAESIRTKQLTRKTIFFGGGWKARGLPKGGFGCGLAIKAKEGEKQVQAGRISLSRTSEKLHCHTIFLMIVFFVIMTSKYH
jgi:hypothetical protein